MHQILIQKSPEHGTGRYQVWNDDDLQFEFGMTNTELRYLEKVLTSTIGLIQESRRAQKAVRR